MTKTNCCITFGRCTRGAAGCPVSTYGHDKSHHFYENEHVNIADETSSRETLLAFFVDNWIYMIIGAVLVLSVTVVAVMGFVY